MEKVIQVFYSAEEADRADRDYYRSLTPQQRLDLALKIYDDYYDASKQRLERVYTVLKREER